MNDYGYKIKQLTAMLAWEESATEQEQHGAHLQHWATGKPINIDAGAIRTLIEYYQHLAHNEEQKKDPRTELRSIREEYLRKLKSPYPFIGHAHY